MGGCTNLAKITQEIAIKFMYRSIVCKFGIPQHIITDNDAQFTRGKFIIMCEDLGAQLHFLSIYRSQGNRQVKVINKSTAQGLKKKIEKEKGL